MRPNCLLIAGEKSGEEHALSFLSKIKSEVPDLEIWGVGGDELENTGMELNYHLKDFSSWGFTEVIGKIPFYFKALNFLTEKSKNKDCKVAILIDFQDFNMRLAKRLKKQGVKILYYVAPQAWAWKPWRASVLGRTVHTLFTILPFEKSWFSKRGVEKVISVAHPVWLTYQDKIKSLELGISKKSFESMQEETKIVLLPGSRNFEIENLLPKFIEAAKELSKKRNCKFALVRSANVNESLYEPYLKDIDFIYENSQIEDALTWADLSMAASGTVTLTCALFEVPTVVAYQTSMMNYYIFDTFLNYSGDVSLANVVHEKRVFPECLQEFATDYNIEKALLNWMTNIEAFNQTKSDLLSTREKVMGEDSNVGLYMSNIIKEIYAK